MKSILLTTIIFSFTMSGCIRPDDEWEDEGYCDSRVCTNDCIAEGHFSGVCGVDDYCSCIPHDLLCDGVLCELECTASGYPTGWCSEGFCECSPIVQECNNSECNNGCIGGGNASGRCQDGACVCVPVVEPECTNHLDCDSVSICISEHCALAYGRDYKIIFHGASNLPEDSPAGESWDYPGGLPDPFLRWCEVGNTCWRTTTDQDTLNPTWEERTPSIRINESSLFRWEVIDEDLADNDGIVGIWNDDDAFQIYVDWIKYGGWSSGGLGSTISFGIEIL